MIETLPALSEQANNLRPGIYQHYRAGQHRVLEIVRHSETLEEMVHYVHDSDQTHWVRPLSMFVEDVVVDGIKRPRFRFLHD